MKDLVRSAQFVYESNLIENFRLISEAEINDQLRLGSRDGHAGAFLLCTNLAENKLLLAAEHLFAAHRLLILEQFQREVPAGEIDWMFVGEMAPQIGGWRTLDVVIGGRRAPHFTEVPQKMAEFFQRFTAALDPGLDREAVFDAAADIHYEYEHIHPFFDGNGRTGRLLANYILAYHGLPIAIFTSADKGAYYSACSFATTELMRSYVRLKVEKPFLMLDARDSSRWRSFLEHS